MQIEEHPKELVTFYCVSYYHPNFQRWQVWPTCGIDLSIDECQKRADSVAKHYQVQTKVIFVSEVDLHSSQCWPAPETITVPEVVAR